MGNSGTQGAIIDVDVAIIGGGPGGSTCGGLLAKYAPELRVAIFEREEFPREHVGESQLPPISAILHELGCWEEVEAAGFPIKIGATYRWGRSPQLWDFEFMPLDQYREEARPRPWSHQARQLALQVDRARYDQILLAHARRLGCRVEQPAAVRTVATQDGRVNALRLADGREVRAHWYVDASGSAGLLRRSLGIGVDVPTALQNIAFWDYWENADWATLFPGGGTRVLVLSIPWGWIWFIPLSATRTSIGFVCPREHYRGSGQTPEQTYQKALAQEPLIGRLTEKATREGRVRATKDWSFVAECTAAENWYLVGESAGFADPILAAGMTLTQTGAREAAYSILAEQRGQHAGDWLQRHYDQTQRERLRQHIRFADFWYSANGSFTDLQEWTAHIARDAGLELDAQEAFRWLGTGGFTHDTLGQVGLGGLDLAGARQVAQRFVGGRAGWDVARYNRFRLRAEATQRTTVPAYSAGEVQAVPCLCRGRKRLPLYGMFGIVYEALHHAEDLVSGILPQLQAAAARGAARMAPQLALHHALQALEVMVAEGWVEGSHDATRPRLRLETPDEGRIIHSNTDVPAA